jgi:hypothetical protein
LLAEAGVASPAAYALKLAGQISAHVLDDVIRRYSIALKKQRFYFTHMGI